MNMEGWGQPTVRNRSPSPQALPVRICFIDAWNNCMLVLPSYEGGRVERLAFTPEGEWLVSVASHPLRRERSAPVRLWNCFDWRQYYRQPVPTH